ncbi:MAG: flippase [Myxococcota bacterium]
MSRRLGLSALRDFLYLTGGEIVGKGVGFVAFAYLARRLEPEAYGAVELAFSLVLLFAFVVEFGTDAIGAREVARDRDSVPRLAAQIPAARLLVALGAIPARGGLALAMGQPPETVRLVWIFSLGLLAIPWKQTWLLQGLEMMGWLSAGGAVRMGVFALGVLLLVRGPEDLHWVAWVEVAAAFVFAGYFLGVQQRRVTPIRLGGTPRELRGLLRQGLPLGLTQAVWSTTQYLPTLLVATFVGGTAIAWFAAAHRIVMSVWTFSWLYHFNLFPSVTRNLAGSREAFYALVRPSLRSTAWAGVGIAWLVTLLGEPLCRLVFGAPYAVAGPTLSVLVWILPATLLSGHARSALIATGHQRFVLYAQSTGAVVMLGLGVVLVPAQGALGGAIAMVVSSSMVFVVSHVAASRLVAPLPWVDPLLRPALALVASWAAVDLAGLGPWGSGGLAAVAYAAAAFVSDPRLLSDLRRVAAAKDG